MKGEDDSNIDFNSGPNPDPGGISGKQSSKLAPGWRQESGAPLQACYFPPKDKGGKDKGEGIEYNRFNSPIEAAVVEAWNEDQYSCRRPVGRDEDHQILIPSSSLMQKILFSFGRQSITNCLLLPHDHVRIDEYTQTGATLLKKNIARIANAVQCHN